jgi:hypothetical protein
MRAISSRSASSKRSISRARLQHRVAVLAHVLAAPPRAARGLRVEPASAALARPPCARDAVGLAIGSVIGPAASEVIAGRRPTLNVKSR